MGLKRFDGIPAYRKIARLFHSGSVRLARTLADLSASWCRERRMTPGWNAAFISVQLLTMAGSMVQGSLGFGLAVVASPLFMLIDPRLVPVTLLVNALAISIVNAWNLRREIILKELLAAFIGRVPGTILAAYLLSRVSSQTLGMLVGCSVLIAVFINSSRLEIRVNRLTSLIAGFFSGLMGTSSGIGGPPMAILYQKEEPRKARANLAFYFVISCIFSLAAIHQAKGLDSDILLVSLSMIPAALVGTWLARYPLRFMTVKTFRFGIMVLCSVAALGVLATAIL